MGAKKDDDGVRELKEGRREGTEEGREEGKEEGREEGREVECMYQLIYKKRLERLGRWPPHTTDH